MEKFFKLKAHNTTVRTEVIAGITTFLAMAYILAVNPGILSQAGLNSGAVFTATALSAAMFLIALLFSPVFLLIPSAATAPALIIVGCLMMTQAGEINYKDPSEGIPAFLTIVMMPFSYSIAEGIVFGVIFYVILKCICKKFKDIPAVTWILFIIFVARYVVRIFHLG